MSTSTLDAFCESLDRLEVGWTRTAAAEFSDVLMEAVEAPVVGAPLPFEGCSLEDAGIPADPTPGQLNAARTGVTAAQLGIANYGTVVLQSAPNATEAVSLFPERHVAVLRASDVVPDMKTAFQGLGSLLREEGASAILATGPSATADMGALVRGAHGPKHVHVIILENR